MTDHTDDARRWTIRHFQPASDYDADQGQAEAGARLREQIDADGYVIDMESLTAGEPLPVTLWPDGTGWEPYQGPPIERGPFTRTPNGPDGFITDYTATATERHTDDVRSEPVPDQDNPEVVWADVPEENTADGGGLRVRHNLNAPVIVKAYDKDGSGTGYLFAQELDANELHVELVPGAARLRIEVDPNPEVEA